MTARLEFFYDYVSPYSYLADGQVEALAQRAGAELVHRPFLLGGVMKAAGNSPPATVAAKGRYMTTDLARWARRYDLPFRFNPHFPLSTVTALRGALAALEAGGFDACHRALFRAMWQDGKDLADASVLASVLAEAGLDAEALLARAGEPEIKDRLRAHTDEAVARGAFGAPTFFVGDEMFFGNDRLDFLEEALSGR